MSSNFSYVAGVELGTNIAAVLGIDIAQVTKMTISMDAEGPAMVTVEAFMFDDEGDLVETLSKYHLVATDGQAVLDG